MQDPALSPTMNRALEAMAARLIDSGQEAVRLAELAADLGYAWPPAASRTLRSLERRGLAVVLGKTQSERGFFAVDAWDLTPEGACVARPELAEEASR